MSVASHDDVGEPPVAGGWAQRPITLLLAVLCGLAFGLTAWRFGWSAELPGYLYFVAAVVALAGVGIATDRLPDLVTLPSYLIGSVLLAGAALVHGEGAPLVRVLVAMVVLSGFYWLGTVPRQGGR